jgi:hypothetical protein
MHSKNEEFCDTEHLNESAEESRYRETWKYLLSVKHLTEASPI